MTLQPRQEGPVRAMGWEAKQFTLARESFLGTLIIDIQCDITECNSSIITVSRKYSHFFSSNLQEVSCDVALKN